MPRIESPCSIDNCLLDTERDACVVCGRTREDIAGWANFGPKERQARARKAKERRHALAKLNHTTT